MLFQESDKGRTAAAKLLIESRTVIINVLHKLLSVWRSCSLIFRGNLVDIPSGGGSCRAFGVFPVKKLGAQPLGNWGCCAALSGDISATDGAKRRGLVADSRALLLFSVLWGKSPSVQLWKALYQINPALSCHDNRILHMFLVSSIVNTSVTFEAYRPALDWDKMCVF